MLTIEDVEIGDKVLYRADDYVIKECEIIDFDYNRTDFPVKIDCLNGNGFADWFWVSLDRIDFVSRITPEQKSTESILVEAERIVNNDRNDQYGDKVRAFGTYSKIVNSLLNEDELEQMKLGKIKPSVVAKVMIAIKLGRESHQHKRDNLVDLCGYSDILNVLESFGEGF